jgi:hypothetical protein
MEHGAPTITIVDQLQASGWMPDPSVYCVYYYEYIYMMKFNL